MYGIDIKSIGIYNSQVARPNVVISKKREATMFELELPIQSGGISYINSECHPIRENLLILGKPGQIRHTKFPYRCYFVHFYINDEYLLKCFMNYPSFIEIANNKKYHEIFDELCKTYTSFDKTDELMLNSLMLKLLYLLLKNTDIEYMPIKHSVNDKTISKALSYIDENLCTDLNLKKVSDYVGLSPNHFHNVFKYALGKTLRTYIEEKKIKKSVYMLQATDKTLAEIAYECGFSSQSYYSYVFKRKMGGTPREYMRKLNNLYEI